MSPEDASEYAKAVAVEYDRIQQQERAFYDEAYLGETGLYPGQMMAEERPQPEDTQFLRQSRGE